MLEVKEIREFSTYQEKTRHSKRLLEQKTDMEFWNDVYTLPLVKNDSYVLRTGFVPEMMNGITQQLIGENPKLYTKSRKDTDASKKASLRIAGEGNRYLKTLLRERFSPYRETFKKLNIRGEAWIYVPHNEYCALNDNWYEENPDLIPVQFILFDPMVVFADPNEEKDGEPERICVSYERSIRDLKTKYPDWNPKASTKNDNNTKVPFLYYIDKDQMYAEADEMVLFRKTNIYGLVPFVHAYAGYGIETLDRDPAKLALSRIGMMRDIVIQQSTIDSDIYFNTHRYAHKHKTLFIPAGAERNPDAFAEYTENPDGISVVQLPDGASPDWFKVDETQQFDQSIYSYADRVFARSSMLYPMSLRGAASGTSGRQEDLLSSSGLAIYQCSVENNNLLWSRACDKAFKIIDRIPNLRTPDLKEGDSNSVSEITVDLRRDDLVDRDRKIANGRDSVTNGQRSLRTHLIKDYGLTEEEADNEIDEILAEKIMFQSPDIAAFLGFKAAQKSGMADELEAYNAQLEKPPEMEMGSKIGSKGGQPRQGNIKTETGAEMVDVSNTAGGMRSPANV